MTDAEHIGEVIETSRAVEGEVMPLTVPTTDQLRHLAHQANEAHRTCAYTWEGVARGTYTMLEQAIFAGRALNEAKSIVGHGKWLAWLSENCPQIAPRSAQEYMQLAKKEGALAQMRGAAHLSISQALRLIGAPKRDTGNAADTAPQKPKKVTTLDVGRTFVEAALSVDKWPAFRTARAEELRIMSISSYLNTLDADATDDHEYGPYGVALDALEAWCEAGLAVVRGDAE